MQLMLVGIFKIYSIIKKKYNEIDNFIRNARTKPELEQKRDEINQEQTRLNKLIEQSKTQITELLDRTLFTGQNGQQYKYNGYIVDYIYYEYMKKYNKTKLDNNDTKNIERILQSKFGNIEPQLTRSANSIDTLYNFYEKYPKISLNIVNTINEITKITSKQAELLVNENVNKQIIETLNKKNNELSQQSS